MKIFAKKRKPDYMAATMSQHEFKNEAEYKQMLMKQKYVKSVRNNLSKRYQESLER